MTTTTEIYDYPRQLELTDITVFHGIWMDKRTAWCRNPNTGESGIMIKLDTAHYAPSHEESGFDPLAGVKDVRPTKTDN